MSKPTVYLAGPIRNAEDPQTWRNYVDRHWGDKYDFDIPEFRPHAEDAEVVEDCLERVREADAVLVRWMDGIQSPGTVMEIKEAHDHGVPVVIQYPGDDLGKFLREHANAVRMTFGSAMVSLSRLVRKP